MTTEHSTARPHSPGDEVNGYVLGDDLAWHATEETRVANRASARGFYMFTGGLAVMAALIVGGLVVLLGGNEASPAQQEAEQIVAQCYTVVQPVNYPRVSAAEEQEIAACAYAATDDPEVTAHLGEALPDGR